MQDFSNRPVSAVMNRDVARVEPQTPLRAALELMRERGISSMVVATDDIAIGILTERDVLSALATLQQQLDAPCHRFMHGPVITIPPEAGYLDAYHRMLEHDIRHLVVLDGQGRIAGMVSESDIVRELGPEYFIQFRDVGSVMSAHLCLLAAGTSVAAAAARMAQEGHGCVIVTDEAQRPAGILTERDVVRIGLEQRDPQQLTLTAVMTKPVLTISATTPLHAAMERMNKNGLRRLVVVDDEGRVCGLLGQRDVTRGLESRYAAFLRRVIDRQNEALQQQRFRTIFNSVNDAIFVHDADSGAIIDANHRVTEMYGYTLEQLCQINVEQISAGTPPYTQQEAAHYLQRAANGEPQTFEWRARHRNGHLFWVEVNMRAALVEDKKRILVSVRDIGARKKSDEKMRRLNWALSALSRGNAALVHAETIQELYDTACDAITDRSAYTLAWIGLPQYDADRSVEVVAQAGHARAYLEDFKVSWGDSPLGQGPVGRALRGNTTIVYNDMLHEDSFRPWAERARKHGLMSVIAVPLRSRGEANGVLAVYAEATDVFGPDEVRLFEELADDIGFGIDSRRTRAAYEQSLLERERHAEQLQATLEQAIGALAATLEKRDPYTAGHERRVAHLAVAIGRRLGLDEHRLHGLRLAGYIHDIGKVQIPSELLSKPSKLTPVEFELIKLHAEAGHDIIKDIAFPWPIAEMVWQHHECLDGSGYPRGITGDEMLQESRILAVADIVEAMSSHRPYRPALGAEPALEQITRLRGSKLDPAAVDACLYLFREAGYQFPE
ncbi:MAG: CBS domain-containing protein [Pseudomonadota bacterium]